MKHATDAALDQLDALLMLLRQLEGLREKKRGTFYRKSSAFLHFHEDPKGLFADLRYPDDWHRFPVNTEAEQNALVAAVQDLLKSLQTNQSTRRRTA